MPCAIDGAVPCFRQEAGLNHVVWDLQTDPAPTFPGMILWGVRTMAPKVPPGTYTVRITADGRTQTTQLEVRANPWITDVTVADMQEQYEFGRGDSGEGQRGQLGRYCHPAGQNSA